MPSIRDKSTVELIARLFCGEFNRNATQTLMKVGYSAKYANRLGYKVLANVGVKAAILRIDTENEKNHIADKHERQRFWTEMYQGKAKNDVDKLRASELLGRSQADFVDVGVNLNLDIPTEPEAYKSWLTNELERLGEKDKLLEEYDKVGTAIAQRY